MLDITATAGMVLKATVDSTGDPTLAVRVSTDPADPMTNGSRVLHLALVSDLNSDDEVLEAPGGAHVVGDRQLLPLLDDEVLDANVDSEGRSSLFIAGPDTA
jgi:Fe-S cluster assembly iron-binding protein IscA